VQAEASQRLGNSSFSRRRQPVPARRTGPRREAISGRAQAALRFAVTTWSPHDHAPDLAGRLLHHFASSPHLGSQSQMGSIRLSRRPASPMRLAEPDCFLRFNRRHSRCRGRTRRRRSAPTPPRRHHRRNHRLSCFGCDAGPGRCRSTTTPFDLDLPVLPTTIPYMRAERGQEPRPLFRIHGDYPKRGDLLQ
jgi:hypothetical protein